MELLCCRPRRKFNRGLKRKPMALIKKLRKAKKEAPPMEKPEVVKTHLRNMIIVPEMVGSIVGVYQGKTFNQVEVKVRWPVVYFVVQPTRQWRYDIEDIVAVSMLVLKKIVILMIFTRRYITSRETS